MSVGKWVVWAAALMAMAGCAGAMTENGAAGGMAQSAASDLPQSVSVDVLGVRELDRFRNGSVLDAMRADMPRLRIGADDSGCPALQVRGPNTAPGITEPTVYVDGTPAVNTCILEELQAGNVARVEVYPLGWTPRPGYRTNSHGLILVFTRSALDDASAADR